MKDSWHKSDLASVVSILESGSRPKGGASTETGEVASLGGENIVQSGGVTLADVKRVPQAFFKRMTKGHLVDGDVLINKDGAQTGKVGIYLGDGTGSACINEHVFLIRGNKEKICQDFLYYTLLSEHGQRQIAAQISGSAQPGLKSSFLKGVIKDIPDSLPEQTKIAEVLSTVDQAIEQTEALIAKQQRIKTGLMQDLLTRGIDEHGNLRSEQIHEFKDSPLGRIPVEWDVKQLSIIVDLKVGYAFKSSWFSDDGIRLLRGENVGVGIPEWKDKRCLPLAIANKFEEYQLKSRDMIIGMDRTFTKQGFKVSLLSEEDAPSLLVQRVGSFIPMSIPRGFMQLLIQSPTYQRELLLQQKGMDIPHLSKSEILAPLVPIPADSDEMDTISNRIETLQSTQQNNIHSLNKLRSLKTALMQDLLIGKKRVTTLLKQEVTNV
jgi:type I restriction enzyme S subunit